MLADLQLMGLVLEPQNGRLHCYYTLKFKVLNRLQLP